MKRKNLITLLAFVPLFSVWGQSSLNPVEKEKLKLPELPQTVLRAASQANEQVDYTKGTFIVNEDWYGHQNSTVNFLSDDGKWTLRALSFPSRRKIRARPLPGVVWRLSMRKR